MADIIGEATVKITGDITPLQEAAEKAKAVGKELEGFKINYMGEQSFDTFQAYTEEIEKQKQAWDEYSATQQDLATTAQETAVAVDNMSDSYSVATTTLVTESEKAEIASTSFLDKFKDRLQTAGQMAEGFVERVKFAFHKKISTDRGVLALAAAAVAAFKKCMDATRETDETMDKSMTRIENAFKKIEASIGRLVEPLVTALAPAFEVLGEVLDKLTLPLKWVADGIDNLFTVIGANLGLNPFKEISHTSSDVSDELNEMANATRNAAKGYKEMQESIADANKALAEAQDEYEQSLKGILVAHEKTVETLNNQIAEANKDYIQSVNERNQAFLINQAKEEEAHQEKVDELMTQLNFLQRYNNAYNKEKLESVKFALAREETLYKKRTEAERKELEIQTAYDKKKRDEKLASYEKELAEEKAFLNKHSQEFKKVRDVILRDEVENLKKRYDETVKNYAQQIATARNAYGIMLSDAQKVYSAEAQAYINAWNSALDKVSNKVKQKAREMRDYGMAISPSGEIFVGSVVSNKYLALQMAEWERENGYALGGYTGQGSASEIAGVVHKGEFVLPKELVDQTTGTPKIGSNITINLSGTFATSEAEKRKVAQQIVDAIRQTNYARLGA